MIKQVIFGGAAAALAFAPIGAVCAAGDYEAPSGIELSIGDVEIDRATSAVESLWRYLFTSETAADFALLRCS